jgi:hypothetical protein
MPDFLATASAWLNSVNRAQVSQTVAIRFGAAESGDVPATIGSSDFQEANDEGIVTNWQSSDFLIAVADYAMDGVVVNPEAGHLIRWLGDDYQVLSPGNEQAAVYSDAEGLMWRIHTKLIST